MQIFTLFRKLYFGGGGAETRCENAPIGRRTAQEGRRDKLISLYPRIFTSTIEFRLYCALIIIAKLQL